MSPADDEQQGRKARRYRDGLRTQGLRPVQTFVPKTGTAAFRAEAHHQSLVVAESANALHDQTFIEAISDL